MNMRVYRTQNSVYTVVGKSVLKNGEYIGEIAEGTRPTLTTTPSGRETLRVSFVGGGAMITSPVEAIRYYVVEA